MSAPASGSRVKVKVSTRWKPLADRNRSPGEPASAWVMTQRRPALAGGGNGGVKQQGAGVLPPLGRVDPDIKFGEVLLPRPGEKAQERRPDRDSVRVGCQPGQTVAGRVTIGVGQRGDANGHGASVVARGSCQDLGPLPADRKVALDRRRRQTVYPAAAASTSPGWRTSGR